MSPKPRISPRTTSFAVLPLLLGLMGLVMGLPGSTFHFLNLLRPSASAASNFIVNSIGDTGDSNLGDGVCNDGTGVCTLRAAIQEANNLAGDDAITFSVPVGSIVTINASLPDITGNLTIDGTGASPLTVQRNTVDGTPEFRIFKVAVGATVSMSHLVVSNGRLASGNSGQDDGGGIYNSGNLTLVNCEVIENVGDVGAGVYSGGSLTISLTIIDSSISNNRSIGGTAGILSTGTFNLLNSTIANNTYGGGIFFGGGNATITNSTISNNTNQGGGAGLVCSGGPSATVNITNTTITGNRADYLGNSGAIGGGLESLAGTVVLRNTIVAGNFRGTGAFPDDILGTVDSSSSFNLIGTGGSGGLTNGVNSNQVGVVNALLGPLAANGGPTLTHALLVGSPAIDAGNSAETLDQRGQPRPIDDQTVTNAAGSNATDIGAYEAHSLEVNSTADTTDGLCRALGTGDGCTLRDAITAANAEGGAELITFAPALTSGGPATITLLTALPDITSSMTIQGTAPNLLTVRRSTAGGTPNFRIFFITTDGITVNLSDLTLSNGNVPNGAGGGILNNGSLVMTNCNLYGNNAVSGGAGGAIFSGNGNPSGGSSLVLNNCNIGGTAGGQPNAASNGGGIFVNSGTFTMTGGSVVGNSNQGIRLISGPVILNGIAITNNISSGDSGGGVLAAGVTLDILNCLIADNSADQGGGVWSNAGVVRLMNSTVSGNSSLGIGGGIDHQSGTLRLTNSTVTNNRSDSDNSGAEQGGGIVRLAETVTLENTIVAGNFVGTGTIANDINGTVDTSSSFNLIGTGGSGGLTNGVNNNQVGVADARLCPLANNGGSTRTHALLPDSPAMEAGNNCVLDNSCTPPLTSALTTDQRGAGFNRAADGNGDGDVKVDIGAYELQPTVVTNTADSGPGSLRQAIVDSNASSLAEAIIFQVGLSGTITLSSALPDIATSMAINGPGASQLTIQRSTAGGTPNFRIFTVNFGSTVSISGLTISNGRTADGTPSPTSGGQGDNGGGILNSGSLTLTDVIVTGNRTGNGGTGGSGTGGFGGFGGGIYSSGTLTMSNVTVSNNITGNGAVGMNGGEGGRGGGIFTPFSSGALTLTNCTISGNTTGRGADGTGASLFGGSGGYGGGFYIEGGTVTMTSVLVENNTTGTADVNPGHSSTGGSGAGILINSFGNVTLVSSTVSGNRTGDGPGPSGQGGSSGGILNAGTLKAISSTISGNSTGTGNGGAGSAAGVYNGGSATLINTTISGNSASGTGGRGGGIYSAGNSQVVGCTITSNSAFDNNSGQGLYAFGGYPPPNVKNSIIANNGGVAGTDATGAFNSQGNNLVGKSDGSTGFTDGVSGDKVGTLASPLNALLGPLVNNGGPTLTHALLAGSPALDGGDNCVFDNSCTFTLAAAITTDQRGAGFSRKVDGPDENSTDTVDIGAFEAQVSIEHIIDQHTNEEISLSVSFNVGGAASITSVTATSSNTALVPNTPANISISGSGSSRVLQITPVANGFGTTTITLTVNGNNSQTMTDTFLFTVNPVNDAPSFTKGPDQTVNENAGAQTINSWASNISAGPNEAGQSVSFLVVNFNPVLFAVAPAISATGTLTYKPAIGLSGTSATTILIMDNGGTVDGGLDHSVTQSFNINIREGGTLAFSSATYNAAEDGGSAAITITRSVGSAGTATVHFATSNGTATAADYTSISQTVTFNDGEVSKTVSVPISDDLLKEADETINLKLSSAGGSGELGDQRSAVLTIGDNDPAGGYIRFASANFNTTESSGSATITVERLGSTTQPVTVSYATAEDSTIVPCATTNSIASSRCDFTTAVGTLQFAAGVSSQTFPVLISQDNFVEGPESLTLTLSDVTGSATLATPAMASLTIADDASEPAANPIDSADVFVRQHYHDFLNREPDAPGLTFWTNQITECQQPGATCSAEVRRINVSAAFFLSIEFQETGYLVYRFYKSAYGNLSGAPVPLRLSEFLPDTQQIGRGVVIGQPGADQLLESNKVAYALDFVSRSRFTSAYPTTSTPAQFVAALFANAAVIPSTPDLDAAINEFGGAGNTADTAARARALRRVAENSTLKAQETNKAFVLMQYFGYLRRNPNDPPETGLDFSGYNFWLGKLIQFNGNFVEAEMVKAFIVSGEYRQRFGP